MESKEELVFEGALLRWSESGWFRAGMMIAVILDIAVWFQIVTAHGLEHTELYFLDVGQGDSSLALLPGGAKVLIDGGPINGQVQKNIEALMPAEDRYIDVVAMTHPQQDHYGGFLELFRNYNIGIFVTSGYDSANASWRELQKIISERDIRTVTLDEMDTISYGNASFKIVSPRPGEKVKDINDASLVMLFEESGAKALFTGDIGAKKEKELAGRFNLDADILKVSHHGSKYSSDEAFLHEVTPAVSVIEVGKNSYGHPTPQTLNRLADIGAQVYRTDKNGMIKIAILENQIQIFERK